MPQGGGGLPGSPLGGGFGAQPPTGMAGPMGGGQPMGMPMQQQQPMGHGATLEVPEDMGCAAGPHAAAWAMAKQRFRAVASAPLGMVPHEVLVDALQAVMKDLK